MFYAAFRWKRPRLSNLRAGLLWWFVFFQNCTPDQFCLRIDKTAFWRAVVSLTRTRRMKGMWRKTVWEPGKRFSDRFEFFSPHGINLHEPVRLEKQGMKTAVFQPQSKICQVFNGGKTQKIQSGLRRVRKSALFQNQIGHKIREFHLNFLKQRKRLLATASFDVLHCMSVINGFVDFIWNL